MELLQEIRDSVSWNMRIVFYTAYDKYMIQAIREAAFDYLLKPFEECGVLYRFGRKDGEYSQQVVCVVNWNPVQHNQVSVSYTHLRRS